MTITAERERVIELLARLPMEDYALYRLGQALRRSLWKADLTRTEADAAFAREVATRIGYALTPFELEEMQRWMASGGPLRWSNERRD